MASTTAVDIMELFATGIATWFANAAVYLLMFAVLAPLFVKGVKLLALWKRSSRY